MNLLAQATTSDSGAATAAVLAAMGGSFVFVLILFVILVAAYYVIIKKTGYNPWLSLLILIPGIGGLIILIMLIFTEWPIQRELRDLRARLAGGGMPPTGAYPPTGGTIYPTT